MSESTSPRIESPAQLNRTIKTICDVLRRDKAKGARLYVPELTWMLFLSALDQRQVETEERHTALGTLDEYRSVVDSPYRWRDWAAPYPGSTPPANGERGWKRGQLDQAPMGSFLSFINDELFPPSSAVGGHSEADLRV